MKVSDFRSWLLAQSELGDQTGTAGALRAIADALPRTETKSLKGLVNNKTMPRTSHGHDDGSLRKLGGALLAGWNQEPSPLRRKLKPDVDFILDLIERQERSNVVNFTESLRTLLASDDNAQSRRSRAVNQELVDTYLTELESALPEESRFGLLMDRLEKDENVKQPELAEITKKFFGRVPSAISRKAALKNIWSRHWSLMDFKAKMRAQAGKSAA